MKKIISILLAAMMLALFACAAADAVPQSEGGKKFESDWAMSDGLVQIYYEEEGYRVAVDLRDPETGGGSLWEYACFYHEDTDSLVSVTSMRTDYTVNPDTGDQVFGDSVYEDFDDENQATEFTITEDGCYLIWNNGRENPGAELQFVDIGRFEGVWRNEDEEVEVEFRWNGSDPDYFFYTVYIQRGKSDADTYASFLMNGSYDPITKRLSADGTCTLFTKNASGEYDTSDDGESYDAFFSKTEDGKLYYETANGIELEYDLLGGD
ncbi:MAG: hypothetical protein IKP40_09690 [Clostridia bacterium]|nr:hypothetical protein [Clostridia bacterium]